MGGNLSPKNNIEYANTDKVMAFDVVAEATDTTDNTIPPVLNPNVPVIPGSTVWGLTSGMK